MKISKDTLLKQIIGVFSKNENFNVSKYSEDEYKISDVKLNNDIVGSIKIRNDGDISIRLDGGKKKLSKLMTETAINLKITHNLLESCKLLETLIFDYEWTTAQLYGDYKMSIGKKRKINECGVICRDTLEDAIEEYMEACDKYDSPFSESDMITFLGDKFNMSQDDIDAEFGDIIRSAINFDEDEYINACDKKFAENEIKQEFREFYTKKFARQMNEAAKLIKDELLKDPNLKSYRRTTAYQNADQEGKYRMLWKYVVREFNTNINDEDELSDVCMEIAMYDEQQF